MQLAPAMMSNNPLAVLTLIAAPAVFTNAASLLALGTGNRLARVVDRTRYITQQLNGEGERSMREMYLSHLHLLEMRGAQLVKAMSFFYTAVGSFAAASLVALLGAMLAETSYRFSFEVIAGLGLVGGTIGFIGLAFGCTLLARETRLALQSFREESGITRDLLQRLLNK